MSRGWTAAMKGDTQMRDMRLPFSVGSRAEEGQGMVEYALILALISIAAIAILTTLGQDVVAVFTSAAGALAAA